MKKTLTVDEWCRRDGRSHDDLAALIGISRSQLYRLRAGGGTTLETARAVQLASSGKVKATQLLGLDA